MMLRWGKRIRPSKYYDSKVEKKVGKACDPAGGVGESELYTRTRDQEAKAE
jgi:hypothetical protein